MLLGNGINRAFNSDSWDDLLNSIDSRDEQYTIKSDWHCPESLKAILLTEDNVYETLKRKKDALGNLGTEKPEKQMRLLQRLLALDFDEILTTNYSYELETAALGQGKVNENTLKKIQRHTDETVRCEQSIMLHTYNSVKVGGRERRIWHLHGEARKPNSMILGAYYYGNLLGKIISLSKKRGNYYAQEERRWKIRSWTDAFLVGDVYVLGFGFGFAESDLWWLLNRKKRENSRVGKVRFYELNPQIHCNRAKMDLLRLMDVEIVENTVENGDWQGAYEWAVADIERIMAKSKNNRKTP